MTNGALWWVLVRMMNNLTSDVLTAANTINAMTPKNTHNIFERSQ